MGDIFQTTNETAEGLDKLDQLGPEVDERVKRLSDQARDYHPRSYLSKPPRIGADDLLSMDLAKRCD
jgi:hypothetical protein